ncbi:MAG: hypothetical protein IKD04_09065 [Clostridia bacterium]|nr:hypothetical protein [Clostridia bacterium]
MENGKRKILTFAVLAVLVIGQIASAVKIKELKTELSNLTVSHSHDIGIMNSNINDIYTNVEEKLKKQASLLSGIEATYGELNITDHTVPVTVAAVPKTVSANTEMSITVCGREYPLTRNGEKFYTTVAVGLFETESQYPLLSVKNGDTTQSEYLEDVRIDNLYNRYLPHLYTVGTIDAVSDKNGIAVDGNITVEYKPANNKTAVLMRDYELVTEIDGNVTERRKITGEITTAGGVFYDFRETYKISAGKDIRFFVEAVDSLGYRHRVLADFSWIGADGSVSYEQEAIYGGEWIYDKDGNLLYGEE